MASILYVFRGRQFITIYNQQSARTSLLSLALFSVDFIHRRQIESTTNEYEIKSDQVMMTHHTRDKRGNRFHARNTENKKQKVVSKVERTRARTNSPFC